MARSSPLAIAVLATVTTIIGTAQSVAQARSLSSVVQELGSNPAQQAPQWMARLDTTINAASLSEVKQALPTLVTFTESPDPQLRGKALLVVYGIASRTLPGDRRSVDVAPNQLIAPYIPRLEPRLTDSAAPARNVAGLLFYSLAASLRPTPPELLTALLKVLDDPQSTQQLSDTTNPAHIGKAPSMGPAMLWALLKTEATYYRDPTTGITEGRNSVEVQKAIIAFLRRPDQTTESISESIRAMALAQAQNPDVNAELLRFLDSPDAAVQSAMLTNLPRLTLAPQDFASAKAQVARLANDPAKQADVQKLASAILPCWNNDRHKGPCPALGP